MRLDQSTPAVVTGGASGLGAATARALTAKGVKVTILDLNAETGEKIAKELGGLFATCDVTSEASVSAALRPRALRTGRSGSWSTAPVLALPSASPVASRRQTRSSRTILPASLRSSRSI